MCVRKMKKIATWLRVQVEFQKRPEAAVKDSLENYLTMKTQSLRNFYRKPVLVRGNRNPKIEQFSNHNALSREKLA